MIRSLIRWGLVAACLFTAGCETSPMMAPPDTEPPAPMINQVAEGPAHSGTDIRLPWVVTEGGGRVREGETVLAQGLTQTYGQPVYCSFGDLAGPADLRLTCIPLYPAAVLDRIGNLYADASCSDSGRLVIENPQARACQPGKLLLTVLALPSVDGCSNSMSVREVHPVPTPPTTYVLQNGKCVADMPGKPGLNYFSVGRILDDNELPHGKRGIE